MELNGEKKKKEKSERAKSRVRMLILIFILIFASIPYSTLKHAIKMAIVILSLKLIKNSLSKMNES